MQKSGLTDGKKCMLQKVGLNDHQNKIVNHMRSVCCQRSLKDDVYIKKFGDDKSDLISDLAQYFAINVLSFFSQGIFYLSKWKYK